MRDIFVRSARSFSSSSSHKLDENGLHTYMQNQVTSNIGQGESESGKLDQLQISSTQLLEDEVFRTSGVCVGFE